MNWTRGRVVGRGSTAVVSLATSHPSGEVIAVKSADLSASESLKRESGFLCDLNCPQIVSYRGCDTTFENGRWVYNLFMEHAPGGSVSDMIRARGRLDDEAAIAFLAREVLLGLDHLHARGIVHCDVKGSNVLMARDGGAWLADLGCAKWARDSHAPIAGTPAFMAPEVARGEEQGFAADIWALGCVVLEMATGRPPWVGEVPNEDPVSTIYRIGHSGEVPEVPTLVSNLGRDFLGKCFLRDPRDRWSARELLKHPFLEGPTSFALEGVEILANQARNNLFVGSSARKGIGGPDSDTPTSVLDRGLWGSIPTQSVDPPEVRIRQLGGVAAADWDEDDWVTVRSNGGREEGGLLVIGTETVGESEEDSNNGELSNGGDNEDGVSCCCCESSNVRQENRGTFVTCKCNKYHVTYGNLVFKNMDQFFVGFIVNIAILSFFKIS